MPCGSSLARDQAEPVVARASAGSLLDAMPLDSELTKALSRAIAEEIPARFVKVVDAVVAPDGRNAVVLVLFNADTPDAVAMISFCLHDEGEWDELVTTDAGDVGTNWLGDRWVAYASGEAPAGATAVVAQHAGATDRRPVTDGGLYVVAFFGPPGDDEFKLVRPPEIRFV